MSEQNKVSGLVLAGGLARRMQNQDKGLILFNHRPMVEYALAALAPLVDELMISANRNQERYSRFGYPVVSDTDQTYDGPLAGILAGMEIAKHPLLLIMPCDSPLMTGAYMCRLLSAINDDIDIAVAFDGQRLHPVFAALRVDLQNDLRDYLQRGERKLQLWFRQHHALEVDFSDVPELFSNINTPDELHALEMARFPVG